MGNQHGIGIGGVLALIFTVLKLVGVISWPWIWVLCPIWIPLFLATIILLVVLFFAAFRK